MDEKEERLLARALGISRVDLRGESFAGCSGLDELDEDAILMREQGR